MSMIKLRQVQPNYTTIITGLLIQKQMHKPNKICLPLVLSNIIIFNYLKSKFL